jgi:hypothetical protein
MASLHDVMVYLTRRFPHPDDLANARLTKMIYLADWRAAITTGRQITAIEWPFNHYGPYVHDVIEEARSSDDFEVVSSATMYGSPKQVVRLKRPDLDVPLEPWEEEALSHVLATTSDLTWARFIELVYSTYPVVSQDRYTTLDLVDLAEDYKKLKQEIPTQA